MDISHARYIADSDYVRDCVAITKALLRERNGALNANFVHDEDQSCCRTESPLDLKARWARDMEGEIVLIEFPDDASAEERLQITREVWQGKRPYQDFAGNLKWNKRA